MKTDFNKKRMRSKRASRATSAGQMVWRWAIMLTLVATLSCAGFVGYQYKKNPQQYPLITTYTERFNTWIDSHRSHLKQDLVKVKKLATVKTEAEPEIHFEFYTALPNMQVNAPVLVNEAAEPALATKKPANVPAGSLKTATSNKNADAVKLDTLEQELSAELSNQQVNQSKFVLQFGTFRSEESAQRYLDTLINAGVQASIVKSAAGEKKVFRVQSGPYNNKNQARLAQIDLEKKGFTGLMRAL